MTVRVIICQTHLTFAKRWPMLRDLPLYGVTISQNVRVDIALRQRVRARWKPSERYLDTLRKRNALPITETEDRLMASAAMSGLNNQPVTGYNTPAAKGIPNAL